MNDLRKQILAAFCQPSGGVYPSTNRDFIDRAMRIKSLALWATDPEAKSEDDLDAGKQFEMSRHEERFETEAQAMVEAGLLCQGKPDDLPTWKAPQGLYQLTPMGVTQAKAVLKEIRGREEVDRG